MQELPNRALLLNIILVMEGVLLAVATVWCFVARIVLAPLLVPDQRAVFMGLLGACVLIATSFLMIGSVKLKDGDKGGPGWLRTLKEIALEELAPLFSKMTVADIILVALASGFSEEIMFRGVLQTQSNIFAASIIFGFFHSPTWRHLPYGFWALLAGLFFGWLMDYTGSLWAPIVAHVTNNLVVLLYFRFGLKQRTESKP